MYKGYALASQSFCNKLWFRNSRTKMHGPSDLIVVFILQHVLAVIDTSESCRQYIWYKCRLAAIWKGDEQFTWLVSRDNKKMPNWGGAPSDWKGCNCSTTSSVYMNKYFSWMHKKVTNISFYSGFSWLNSSLKR